MADVTRRQFLRHASIGAVATGALAAGGAGIFQAVSGSADAAPLRPLASAATPAMEGSDIFAHVVDAKKGLITIFVGTRAVTYTNTDLAQQLLRASQ